MTCKIRSFSTLRGNTWFLNASLQYVVLQRIAEIRGFSTFRQNTCFFHSAVDMSARMDCVSAACEPFFSF